MNESNQNTTITTLATWKRRLTIGTSIRQVYRKFDKDFTPEEFIIQQVQSNGIWLQSVDHPDRRRGWIPFPKRNEIVFTDTGWQRLEKGERIAEYQWT